MSLDDLLDMVGPGLAGENAFRVTGLPVDASARAVRRREQELTVRAKLGTSQNEGLLLPLDPPPDLPAVQDALQRLRDPVRRLADEFFWFWPLAPDGPDEALEHLRAGDSQRASQVWLGQSAGRARAVATHNLAVLAQFQVMDSEEYSAASWSTAFELWSRLFTEDGFWDVLAARIAELKDPRLASVSSGGVRRRLPEKLLALSAGTAVRLFRADRTEDARGHVALMHESGLADRQVVQAVLAKAFDFEFTRIRGLSEDLGRKLTPDRAPRLVEDADAFLAETRPALVRLQAVLPEEMLWEIRNDVARAVVLCGAFRLRFVDDPQGSRRLFQEALPHVTAPDLRDTVKANLEKVSAAIPLEACWFCKKNKQNPVSDLEHMMARNVQRESPATGLHVPEDRIVLKVPRCLPCKQRHEPYGELAGVRVLTWTLMIFGIFFAHQIGVALIAFAGSLACFIVRWKVVSRRRKERQEKIAKSVRYFPPLRKYLADGWRSV